MPENLFSSTIYILGITGSLEADLPWNSTGITILGSNQLKVFSETNIPLSCFLSITHTHTHTHLTYAHSHRNSIGSLWVRALLSRVICSWAVVTYSHREYGGDCTVICS